MTKIFKSNKIISSLLIILCIFLIFNPKLCSNSCLNAITVWTFKIFPVMFPFFVLTKTIVETSNHKQNFMDKFFSKTLKTSPLGLNIFLLSCISGYPMGAKIICVYYEQNRITNQQAKHMMSFCSISGPMFMIGTVGVGIFCSFKAGVVILISNIIAALINGLIHKDKSNETVDYFNNFYNKKEFSISDIVFDSLTSILMVGGFVILSFLLIDTLISTNILPFISNTISCVFNNSISANVVQSFLCGIIEITRGAIDLSSTNLNIQALTVLSSGLIGFGGFSILFQSLAFLNKLNIKFKEVLFQKTTQGILSTIIAFLLVIITF